MPVRTSCLIMCIISTKFLFVKIIKYKEFEFPSDGQIWMVFEESI